ncbi:TLC domain-containing protein 2-like [Populus alba x Populus x berolinensis]|nr:TLC domain-containing protein 2-like [Populus alba]KAJ6954333.1 TLC domain-containing protein 2-like [Populus alba x Populus x berolinensis]
MLSLSFCLPHPHRITIDTMARRTSQNQNEKNKAGTFFLATLILWFVSVLFEIIINKRSELLWIVAGALFFQIANWVVRSFISRDPLFVNTSVSLLHSTIISVSVVFILANQRIKNGPNGMFEHSQLVGGTWEWAYAALCFSCGYFAYDQLDMLHYRLYSGLIPSILVHHLILLVCFTLALYRNVTINYLILTLVCELHSIFLHVRKVRRMAGVRDAKSTIVRMEWVLNWLTFIFARTLSHILITIKLIADAPRFEKGVVLPLALFGMAGMNLINAGLGIDLFNAFTRERNPQKSSSHRHGE